MPSHHIAVNKSATHHVVLSIRILRVSFRRYKIAICRVNLKFKHFKRAFSAQHEDLRPSNATLAQHVAMKPLPLTLHDDPHLLVVLKPAGLAVHGKGESLMDFIQTPAKDLVNGSSPFIGWTMAQEGPWWLPNQQLCFDVFKPFGPMSRKPTTAGWKAQCKPRAARLRLHWKAKRVARFNTLGHRSWAVHGHATLVEWQLRTGRTHQIRRHAAAIGHPIVGDQVYGSFPRYTGHGLHLTCTRLAFRHPITNEAVDIVTPPAKKMKRAVPGNFQCEGMPTSPWLKLFSPD